MKIALLTFVALLAAPLAKAAPSVQNHFKDCWMESGPQAREDALKIPDELLQDNWSRLKDLLHSDQVNDVTYFRLNIDPKSGKLSLNEDQSFKDMATVENEVIVQIGGSFYRGGSISGDIETSFGSAYTRTQPRSIAGTAFGEIYLQYVSLVKNGYRDLRLHCTYQE